jgi:hypothetical protein
MRGSQALARKFDRADALGVACGRRNGLVVVDVDAPQDKLVADVMRFYGESPLVSRTPSGGHHVFYRSNGPDQDRRRIRDPRWRRRSVPVDVLGNGFVVLPPSRGPNGAYTFVQGTPDDLERLPLIRTAEPGISPPAAIPEGRRNNELWRHCMRLAARAPSIAKVLESAHRFNASCAPALEQAEVISTAQSAWSYNERGANRFGQLGAYFSTHEVVAMLADQDAFFLLAFLRAHNGPWAKFMCANGLSE